MEEQDCVYYTQESTVKYCVRLGGGYLTVYRVQELFLWRKVEFL